MKAFFIFSILFFFTALSADLVKYSVSHLGTNDLHVTLEFTGDPSGTSQLFLPNEWADQKELYKEIYDLQCLGYSIEETEEPDIKIIHHNPSDLIKINYKVHLFSAPPPINICFRPLGDSSYFFFIGHGLFILPQHPKSRNFSFNKTFA